MSKLLALLALGLVALTSACSTGSAASSADEGPSSPVRVTYVSFTSGQRLELVNEAHTSRLDQYSEVRNDASRKVQTNDVMAGLVEVLEDNGFEKRAQQGPAPTTTGSMAWALEIEDDSGLRHIGAVPGLTPGENQSLLRLAAAFVDTYNATYSLQAVELKDGAQPFQPAPSKPRK